MVQYEPLMTNRFYINSDLIPSYIISSYTININSDIILKLSLRLSVNDKINSKLITWKNIKKLFNFEIQIIDPTGEVYETYIISGAKITDIEFYQNWEDDSIMKTQVTFNVNYLDCKK